MAFLGPMTPLLVQVMSNVLVAGTGYVLFEKLREHSQKTRDKLEIAKKEGKKKGDPKYFYEQMNQITE